MYFGWLSTEHARTVDLRGADLSAANLNGVNLSGADLVGADLSGSTLIEANLQGADLSAATLSGTILSDVDLKEADLRGADLTGANMVEADLSEANFTEARLSGANLQGAILSDTVFGNIDLSAVIGLDSCDHQDRSIIDFNTLQRSGHLPLSFLRGVGLPEELIDSLPHFLHQMPQKHSCFISYSSKDQDFAKRLHADLQDNGVRCWFAPHNMPIGAKTWDAIDEAIEARDKLLLILSRNSIASGWVEDEVSKAAAKEREKNQLVLFPVRIDNVVMTTREPWARRLRDQRNIGDFRKWKAYDSYQLSLNRLLRDLTIREPSASSN